MFLRSKIIFLTFILGGSPLFGAEMRPSCIPFISAFSKEPAVLKLFAGESVSALRTRLKTASHALQSGSKFESLEVLGLLGKDELFYLLAKLVEQNEGLFNAVIDSAQLALKDHHTSMGDRHIKVCAAQTLDYLKARITLDEYDQAQQKMVDLVSDLSDLILALSTLRHRPQNYVLERLHEVIEVIETLATWEGVSEDGPYSQNFAAALKRIERIQTKSRSDEDNEKASLQIRDQVRLEIDFWINQIAWWESR